MAKPSNRKTDAAVRRRVLKLFQEKASRLRRHLGRGVSSGRRQGPRSRGDAAELVEASGTVSATAEESWPSSLASSPEQTGELVQMDGSHHDWFGGRGPTAELMEMVDDATGRTLSRFS